MLIDGEVVHTWDTVFDAAYKNCVDDKGDKESSCGWVVESGSCKILEDCCISDNDAGLDYPINMDCKFSYQGDATITITEFEVETAVEGCYDWLVIDGKPYCDDNVMLGQPLPFNTFTVTGTTDFQFQSDGYGDSYAGFNLCAVPSDPVDDKGDKDVINTLAGLHAWCDASHENCEVCRGEYTGVNCYTKPDVIAKCRKFKGTEACDMIVGCKSKTNKKGKVKCKGKKHGLA